MVGRSVANDIKNRMSMVKERLMEKLAAASVPSEALENARLYFESVIKDVTTAAQGLTKEALQRIKSHLADIMPSLSPSLTSKMVDDAEEEATTVESRAAEGKEFEGESNEELKSKAYASPVSSFFSNYLIKPTSKL
ncbi:uncharacterized protein LOC110728611 [Chenopodium quinoa]|uniref:uncharacterized protein LOC110728611 n=1 Tax=Chenopodium quinoa TaxID=63459 RepID=UPI000B77FF83|nr:uncharacterized protein LOC110728611 [Chenopodium quinoa]